MRRISAIIQQLLDERAVVVVSGVSREAGSGCGGRYHMMSDSQGRVRECFSYSLIFPHNSTHVELIFQLGELSIFIFSVSKYFHY